mgnify:CR=1 FL=1
MLIGGEKESDSLRIREYRKEDGPVLAKLFYQTVHTVNVADYTKIQLDVWAPKKRDLKAWNASFLRHRTVVAELGGQIVGFGDIDKTGYLDRLYVHADYQRRGIATAICDRLEEAIQKNIITHASITARPFFEKRGYKVIKKQNVERQGIFLTNFVMEKIK